MNDKGPSVVTVDEFVKAPEGVPDSADYISPDEEPPDDAVVIPGPKDGQYAVSPDEFPDEIEMTDAVAQFISDSGADLTPPEEADWEDVDAARDDWEELRDNPGPLIDEYGTEEAVEIIGALKDYIEVVEEVRDGEYHDDSTTDESSGEDDPESTESEESDDDDSEPEETPMHEQIQPGDTVVIDASDDPEVHGRDEVEGEVAFIGPDWVELETRIGGETMFEVENIKDFEYESILPDMEFLERYEADGLDVKNAALNMGLEPGVEDYSDEIQDRAEEMSPTGNVSEQSLELFLDAARDVIDEEMGREGLEQFAEALDNQVRPHTLEAGEVDDVPTDERLENCFDFADEIKGAREAGIEGGNTKGDEIELMIYADGSRDFATPTDAYFGAYADTGVVEGPNEAVMNNRDAPKVIDALGGSTCDVAVTEDPSGEEYIVKEGIEGKTVGEILDEGGTPFDSEEAKESAVDTLAAAFFVGNKDLHRENVVMQGDELVIIDHDSAGPEKDNGEWMGVHDVAMGLPGIPSDELAFAIYEKAADIVRGDADLPDDIDPVFEEYIEEAANKALTTAQRDPSANVSSELVDDSNVDNVVEHISELEEGDRIAFYDSMLHEEVEGEVKFLQRTDDGYVAIVWDDEGYEYEIEDPTDIEEVL